MLMSLWLPIVLSSVALFFASFLSWMIVPIHRKDWIKLTKEDDFMEGVRKLDIPEGSYMFPGCDSSAEMKSQAYTTKWEAGPRGIITLFEPVSMGKNLALSFLFFLGTSLCLGYLATLAIEPGAEFRVVFRFVSTAGLMTFLSAMLQHSIWFHNRITGHVIEAVAYAAITGTIFGLMWPGA